MEQKEILDGGNSLATTKRPCSSGVAGGQEVGGVGGGRVLSKDRGVQLGEGSLEAKFVQRRCAKARRPGATCFILSA